MNQARARVLFIILIALLSSGYTVFADGFIVVPPDVEPVSVRPDPFPLEVKYHHVTVDIRDRTALTSIDQVFYNPGNRVLEGEYIFPVPRGAVIRNFSMFIDGRETQAEMLDAEKARAVYEEIVRRTLDPALLEYQGADIFRVRIFPIEPRGEKRVKISYSEILAREGALCEYVYPLNTEKFSAAPLDSVSVTVTIESAEKLKNIFSTTHSVDVVRKGDKNAVASWEAENARPDTDFKLYIVNAGGDFGVSFLPFREKGADGYFFLDISPGFWDKTKARVPKDITFVLDVSGSMAGLKLEKAKNALLYCLEQLSDEDRFGIVRFSTEAEALFDRIVAANAAHKSEARDFIRSLIAVGGTNIEEALTTAIALHAKEKTDGNRVGVIVLITDGKPTIRETDADKLTALVMNKNKSNLRIFTVGIDETIDTILLDKLTTQTRAWRVYISPREDIEMKISSFYRKIDAPVLANVRLSVGRNIQLSTTHPRPTELPDVFLGTSLTILGRYRGSGKTTITLTGTAGNTPVELEYDLVFPEENTRYDSVPPLWAARRVGYLLEQIRLNGEHRELVDEVTGLARDFGIITPYTSYLILEDEAARVGRRELSERDATMRNIAPPESELEERSREGYAGMKEKSGSSGVAASDELQTMQNAQAAEAAKSRLPLFTTSDAGGDPVDVQSQVRNVNNRAFYNSGSEWIDSAIQAQKPRQVNRIQFASREYFDLLSKKPESSAFLALGRNVRFMLGDELYEIFE